MKNKKATMKWTDSYYSVFLFLDRGNFLIYFNSKPLIENKWEKTFPMFS